MFVAQSVIGEAARFTTPRRYPAVMWSIFASQRTFTVCDPIDSIVHRRIETFGRRYS